MALLSDPVLLKMPVSEPVPIAAPAREPAVASSSDSDESSPPTALLSSAASSDGGRDSGVEADSFEPPDEMTARALVEAVEFYFSDENLLRDAFLLKHVKRNKEGFVSVKLISSFKRVKHISRDWRVVAHALQQSGKIELSDAGTKARRLQTLPEHDETVTSRTVVAVNLPLENPTIASVSEMFGGCGDISSIRVLKPGSNVPVEVRAAFNKHPDVAWEQVNCAVVEFDLQEQARKAKDTMSAPDPTDPAGMHILPIGKVSNKKKSRQEETPVEEPALVGSLGVIAADAQKKRRQRRKKTMLAYSESRGSISGTDGEMSCSSFPRRSSLLQGCVPLMSQPPPLLSVPPPPLLSQPPPLLSQPPPLLSCPPPLLPLPAGLVARRQSPPSRSSVFASTDIRLLPDGGASISISRPPPAPAHTSKPPPAANTAAKPPAAAGKSASERRHKKTPPAAFDAPPPPGTCPWVQRRKASGVFEGDRRGSLIAQENVVRAPRGPDGTSGFTSALRRSRLAAAAAPAQN